MNKKLGIGISIGLALIFTLLIVMSANHRYAQLAQTVQVAQVNQYIHAGQVITAPDVTNANVLKQDSSGMASYSIVINQTAQVNMVKGQYVYQSALSKARSLQPGFEEVYVPVDLSSSALALPGDRVNVHVIDRVSQKSQAVLKNILVLDCRTSQGQEVTVGPASSSMTSVQENIPASIGLMVPVGSADGILYAASEKNLYLTKVSQE